jgi:four helix bundle protein
MRRAAVSIPSNIAEGSAKQQKEFIQYLYIALGSLSELETQIIISENSNTRRITHSPIQWKNCGENC